MPFGKSLLLLALVFFSSLQAQVRPPERSRPPMPPPTQGRQTAPKTYPPSGQMRPPSAPLPAPTPSPAEFAREILSVVENQLNAIQNKNFILAYDNYTTTDFKNKTSLEEFSFFLTSYQPLVQNKNASFGNMEFKGGIFSIQGTLTANNGSTLQLRYFLAREGALWKIIGIKVIRPEITRPEVKIS